VRARHGATLRRALQRRHVHPAAQIRALGEELRRVRQRGRGWRLQRILQTEPAALPLLEHLARLLQRRVLPLLQNLTLRRRLRRRRARRRRLRRRLLGRCPRGRLPRRVLRRLLLCRLLREQLLQLVRLLLQRQLLCRRTAGECT